MRCPHDITDLAPIEKIEQAYNENKYIVTTHKVFRIKHDESGWSAKCILTTESDMTEREYDLMSGRRVIRVLERLFNEED